MAEASIDGRQTAEKHNCDYNRGLRFVEIFSNVDWTPLLIISRNRHAILSTSIILYSINIHINYYQFVMRFVITIISNK